MRGDGTLTLKWSYFLFRPSSLHPPCDILECKAREPGVEKRGTLSSSVQGNSWLTSFETDAENILLTSCSFCPLETVKGDGRRFAKHKNTMRKIAHEKCIILQGMPTLYSEKSRMISYKEQLQCLMDKGKDIQKYSVLLKNSALVVMRDCRREPHPDSEGALRLSTWKWRQQGRRRQQAHRSFTAHCWTTWLMPKHFSSHFFPSAVFLLNPCVCRRRV